MQVPEGEYGLLFTDGSKFGRAEQLHMALLGLWAFEKREKRLPKAGNLEEAEVVVKLAEEVRVFRLTKRMAVLLDIDETEIPRLGDR